MVLTRDNLELSRHNCTSSNTQTLIRTPVNSLREVKRLLLHSLNSTQQKRCPWTGYCPKDGLFLRTVLWVCGSAVRRSRVSSGISPYSDKEPRLQARRHWSISNCRHWRQNYWTILSRLNLCFLFGHQNCFLVFRVLQFPANLWRHLMRQKRSHKVPREPKRIR